MRNKTFVTVAAVLSLLATSCNKDNAQPEATVQTPITIHASYAANGTKVSYAEDGNTISATWQAGDELKVVYNGSGTLNAIASGTGSLFGAGIGGGYGSNFSDNMPCGNIVINGGIINATGGYSSAGIGGSLYSACGSITIASTVTSVTATTGSSSDTAPIGKGNNGWPATMTFGNQTMYDSASDTGWPTVEDGQNYGGLTLAISNEGKTWTLTPAN